MTITTTCIESRSSKATGQLTRSKREIDEGARHLLAQGAGSPNSHHHAALEAAIAGLVLRHFVDVLLFVNARTKELAGTPQL